MSDWQELVAAWRATEGAWRHVLAQARRQRMRPEDGELDAAFAADLAVLASASAKLGRVSRRLRNTRPDPNR